MKKVISISLLIVMLCIALVGCSTQIEKNVVVNEDEKKVVTDEDEWKLTFRKSNVMFDDDVQKAFDNASSKYEKANLELVVLLGEQVVAGTNYMFLCQAESDGVKTYKTVIVYKDLQGNSEITLVNDFDVKKYVNENKDLNTEMIVGGWKTEIPGKPIMLEEEVQSAFDQATEKMVGTTYYPIAVLAKQEKEGTNYAVLCYGRLLDQNATEGIFVLTLNVNETGTSEVVGISAVDLKEYNK